MITSEHIAHLTRAIERLHIAVETIGKPAKALPELLSAVTIAKMLDCSSDWIMRAGKAGEFPPPDEKIFVGHKGWRWRRETVERWLATKATGGTFEEDAPAPPYKGLRRVV